MEPCSDIKRNEVLTQATTWMKAENIMMSLKKKTKPDTKSHILYDCIYTKIPQNGWIDRNRRKICGDQGLGSDGLMGMGASFWGGMENALELDSNVGYTKL